MHPRYTPLQNWERVALNEYTGHHQESRGAYLSAWFLLALRLRDARTLLAPAPYCRAPHHAVVCAVSASAVPNLETRLCALFAE